MMKLLSLWQPYATCMERGWKTNETRGFKPVYRGDVAIHAALKRLPAQFIDQIYREAGLVAPIEPHPHGVILCVVELFEVLHAEHARAFLLHADTAGSAREILLGNYSDGRYAWCTRNLRRLSRPVRARGVQGMRDIDPEIEAEVRSVMLPIGETA